MRRGRLRPTALADANTRCKGRKRLTPQPRHLQFVVAGPQSVRAPRGSTISKHELAPPYGSGKGYPLRQGAPFPAEGEAIEDCSLRPGHAPGFMGVGAILCLCERHEAEVVGLLRGFHAGVVTKRQ